MSDGLLTARGVRKRYGNLEVLRGVDLSVAPGEALAIIGPNGAGKTTLFKVLTGETLEYEGAILLDGRDISKMPSYLRVRAGFGRTFQVARVFGDMSTLTNVVLGVESRKARGGAVVKRWWQWRPSAETQEEAVAILASVGLRTDLSENAGHLSHGDKKRLELAITLAGLPRILMLDEPTAGMSIADRRSTTELLWNLKRKGITIVLTEHDMNVVFGLADRIMVLNYGEVVCVGEPEAVRTDEAVRRVYLGTGTDNA